MEIFNMDGFETEESPADQEVRSTSRADHPFFTETWDAISKGLDGIWLEPYHHNAKAYMKIYQLRFDFSTKGFRKGDRNHANWNRSSEIYRQLGEYLRRSLPSTQSRILTESKTSNEAGLRLYLQEWERYKQFAKQVDHLFTVRGGLWWAEKSDYHWGRIPTIWSLHVTRWKEAVFDSSSPTDGGSISQIAEEYSEQADEPSLIIRPFQEIANLLERGPFKSEKEPPKPGLVDYSVLCPVHNDCYPAATETPAVNE